VADSSDISARADDDEWVRAVIARALLADSEDATQDAPVAAPVAATPDPAVVAMGNDDSRPSPIPTIESPPDFNWGTADRLDTASIRARAAEGVDRVRRIGDANLAADVVTSPSTVNVATEPLAPVEPVFPTAPQPTAPPLQTSAPAQPVTPTAQPVIPTAQPVMRTEQAPPAETNLLPPFEPPTAPSPVFPTERAVTELQPDIPARPASAASAIVDAPIPQPVAPGPRPAPDQVDLPIAESGTVRRQDQVIEPGRVEHGFSVEGGTNPFVDTDGVDDVMVKSDVSTSGFRSSDFHTIIEWLAVIGSALAVALLIKAFVLQAFWIPSESMETTVNRGDRILVNKVSYRLHDVRRGDLVVFRKIEGTAGTDDLIKRAIGLPGETIEVRDDGQIWIWGPGEGPEDALLLDEPYLNPQNALLRAPSASDPVAQDIWDERCTNNRTPGRCTLDDSSFFMLGDNRVRSSDSRFFGPVPEENVVGRAFVRIWPLGDLSTL